MIGQIDIVKLSHWNHEKNIFEKSEDLWSTIRRRSIVDFDVYIKTYNENKTPHCLSSIKQRTDWLRHQVYRIAVRKHILNMDIFFCKFIFIYYIFKNNFKVKLYMYMFYNEFFYFPFFFLWKPPIHTFTHISISKVKWFRFSQVNGRYKKTSWTWALK